MAALEPTRKRLTSFTIDSIVGRSSPSPTKPSPAVSSGHVGVSRPRDQLSPSRKPASDSESVPTLTSSAGAAVRGATSAGRHLELLARFATPNITGSPGSYSTSAAILGCGSAGAATLAEALLRAGGHLPYAAVELVNRDNGLTGPSTAAASRLQGQASMLDGAGPAALMFRGTVWNPQDLARRLPAHAWSASLIPPLTPGVRPTAGHAYMHHPYPGKIIQYVRPRPNTIETQCPFES